MQIKKITSLVLAAALSISLAACDNSQTTAVTSGQDNQQAESTQTADSSEAKDPESAQNGGPADRNSCGKRKFCG